MLGLRYIFLILFVFILSSCGGTVGTVSPNTERLEAEKLVSQSADILPDFEANSHEWNDVISKRIKQAKAIMIVPNLLKGGLFVGGEYGNGVLLVRQFDGSWSYPSFFEIYAGTLGFQIGFERTRHLLLIMSDEALEGLRKNRLDFGGEINVAVGTAGGSAETSTTSNFGVDIFSYSLGSGAYAGVNFEGGYTRSNNSRNAAYYDEELIDVSQIMEGDFINLQANELRSLVSVYAD